MLDYIGEIEAENQKLEISIDKCRDMSTLELAELIARMVRNTDTSYVACDVRKIIELYMGVRMKIFKKLKQMFAKNDEWITVSQIKITIVNNNVRKSSIARQLEARDIYL